MGVGRCQRRDRGPRPGALFCAHGRRNCGERARNAEARQRAARTAGGGAAAWRGGADVHGRHPANDGRRNGLWRVSLVRWHAGVLHERAANDVC